MHSKSKRLLVAGLLLQAVLAPAVRADDVAPSTDTDPRAKQLMDAMAARLAAAEQFGVELEVTYEVVQEDGRKLEFGEEREVSVARPDKVKIESEDDDGSTGVTLFDGKTITLYDSAANVYVTAPQKGDLDASVIRFVRDLKMRLPLAPLLMKTLPDELARRVQSVSYVEEIRRDDTVVHHIAGRTPTIDFEMWIDGGKVPLLHKMALTYRGEEGQPRFRAEFDDWDLDPDFGKSEFRFEAPEGSRPLPFAAELIATAAAAMAAPAAAPEGDAK